jgi:O-antigen/teichoic acid export membrane protein
MLLFYRLGQNFIVYIGANALYKGLLFLLVPIYVQYLGPENYGILSVVSSVVGILFVIFSISLSDAMVRFYFDYRDYPERLREFWGTLLTFIFLVSVALSLLLLFLGEKFLRLFLGGISFFPYMVLGLIATIFQPTFLAILAIFQAKGDAKLHSIFFLGQLVVHFIGIVISLEYAGLGAEGPLLSYLCVSVMFFILGLWFVRREIKCCLVPKYISLALRFSLPLVPQALSGRISKITGLLFLNKVAGLSSAGIYHVGYNIGFMMALFTEAINRAYIPTALEVLESNQTGGFENLKEVGMLLVVFYCFVATFISFFSPEFIWIIASNEYYSGYVVIPYIAFYFALIGISQIFINIFLFEKNKTNIIALGAAVGFVLVIGLCWVLVPSFGMKGAAIASLASQFVVTAFLAAAGIRHEKILWDYQKILIIVLVCFAMSLQMAGFQRADQVILSLIKLSSFLALFLIVNCFVWRDAFYFIKKGQMILKKVT